jgi:hypothetical protein
MPYVLSIMAILSRLHFLCPLLVKDLAGSKLVVRPLASSGAIETPSQPQQPKAMEPKPVVTSVKSSVALAKPTQLNLPDQVPDPLKQVKVKKKRKKANGIDDIFGGL